MGTAFLHLFLEWERVPTRFCLSNFTWRFRPVFLKVGGIAPLGANLMGKGAKKHQGGENAQLLIDHWVNFSNLSLWLVRFLKILIYYDSRWRLLLKQFICWIFNLDRLCAQLQCGLFQGCGAVVKLSQLRFRSSFHEHCSSSGALGFHEYGSSSGAIFFHGSGSGPALASVRFHTLIF